MNGDLSFYADVAGLARLRTEAKRESPEALRQAAAQFEALFTQMLFKSMRAANLGGGLFDSQQSEFYRDMFDRQISMEMSRGKGLGIAELLIRQLGGVDPQRIPEATRSVNTLAEIERQPPWKPENPVEFVKTLWPHAKRIAARLGVSPPLLLAQTALETGWGKRLIQRPDGSPSFNLFGIKAGSGWQGDTVAVSTLEYADGAARRERALFRAYDSFAESFEDYARLLDESPRYREVLERGPDPEGFADALQRAGYATDPDYARKIISILHGKTLGRALDALKIDWPGSLLSR